MPASIRDIWTLASTLARAAQQRVNALLKPLGLGSAEGTILLHLMVARDEVVSQEHLVGLLGIDKAAISRAVDSLAAKGYVTRQRRADDKRAYRLTLTEKGLAAIPALEGIFDHVYMAATRGIPPADFDAMMGLLSRIAGNLSGPDADGAGAPDGGADLKNPAP